MREIKFRVRDTETGKVYQPEEICRIHFDGGELSAVLLWDETLIVYPELIGYTGRKDKNGTEVYEGDGVSILWDDIGIQTEEEGVVYWDDVHAGFYVEYDPDSSVPISSADIIEVIGVIECK